MEPISFGGVNKVPQVVVIGAGFGGLNAARQLRRDPVKVILIDRHNYHLFQPLLYQVATAGLSPDQIASPVRTIFRKQANFEFRLTEVQHIDLDARHVYTPLGLVPYDYLVIAAGSEENYFGLKSLEGHSFTLKDLEDAEGIRNHLLRMFERADQVKDPAEQKALRTIVIAGGGPTGVECAGAISELIRLVLRKDFPKMETSQTRVLLLEAADRLLAGFPPELGQAALETLSKKGVEVQLYSAVADYDGWSVRLKDGEQFPAATFIWAAGVRAAGLVDSLPTPKGRQGRAVVEDTLQLPGHPEVFVIGDAAALEHDGVALPMLAPVAIQQAKVATENIRRLMDRKPLLKFQYKDPGSLATIGRNQAVARLGKFNFHGFLAWVLWLGVHLIWLIGFRNRVLVLINWAWDYLFYERGVRLITSAPDKGGMGEGPAE